ncbi:MAG: phage portal protein [Oligoflexia bacterium]|nr:phage portal protein [Oligoflexia bacterium]
MANFLDKAISFVSPTVGVRRARARLLEKTLSDFSKRKYEGATSSHRTGGWLTSNTSANAETHGILPRLRDRSRDLVRNNPYASRAIQIISANTIGTGIIPNAKSKNQNQSLKISGLWKKWAETTECDADGVNDFYGLQTLVMRTIAESGEVLVRRRRRFSQDKTTVPFQLQILEPDFIDTFREGKISNSGNYIIQGIEFDVLGRRVAYYLYKEHPGNNALVTSFGLQSSRVDASEILHLYRVDRPGQVRGVPWSAPIMLKLRDFDEFEDAQIVRQKIAACFAAFIRDIETPVDLTSAQTSLGDKIEPGAIEALPPGKDITFPNPPQLSDYAQFSSITLHAIAIGFGIPYEALTGDLSQVNFSSGRMGWLEFQRNIEQWRWNLIIPRFCDPIWQWFLEAASLLGNDITGIVATWTPPRREMIDPAKEVSATRDAIRSGLLTQSEAIRQQGYDPEQQFEEMNQDNQRLDSLGLILDSDPRKTSQAGGPINVAAAAAGGA